LREVEGCGARDGERGAEVAGGVADHEGSFRGGEGGCGDDQITLVLARRRVEHNDEFIVGWWVIAVSKQSRITFAKRIGKRVAYQRLL
jgi:hypothetical protein